MDEASCRGSDLFFGHEGESLYSRRDREFDAINLCLRCPVVVECRDLALQLPDPFYEGVAGAMTYAQRARWRTRQRVARSLPQSATPC